MSAIFISHSHSDNAAADDCKRKLATQGHHSVFLDFDPAAIPAGRNWEKELYAALRACQAVIVLCSPQALASPWCFAEITQARALGKPVFPLLLADGTLPPLLSKVQAIDLTRAPEDGWRRLWAGLRLAGLDPTDPFDWDGTRPPYPGFLAFQEKDAAVYFGRDAAIHVTLETLNRLQRLGGARLLIVLGASGSGKSSLMRAGVLPRLKRDAERWLVVGPFRPLTRPVDECALALADAYAAAGDAHDWRALRDTLRSATQAGDAESLVDLAYDLRIAAGRREAGILLVVDQFEELLGHNAGQSADLFCRLLTQVLRAPDCPLLAAITLRSDFLGSLQTRPHLQELPYEAIHLAPMPLADFTQVIEGPARIAGVELGAGLTQAMVADAATDDALPLLAFTLRELWDHHGGDGRLTLEEYCDRLGGLKASVGRAAEGIFAAAGARAEAQLHRAFLSMVRVDEDGRYIRKPARWVDLPEDTHALLERYVQARLLVARGDGQARVLEVAHDALFRSWDRLAAWLNLDREFLLWRSRLQVAVGDWARTAHSDGSLLRGPLLDEALRWLGERVADLDRVSVEFIEASRRHEAGEQQRWKELYSKALSRQLAAQAMAEADPRLGLLLCGAALERSHTREAQYNLLELLHKTHYLQTSLYGHAATTSCVAFSPRGDLLASGSHDGDIVLWNLTADPVARQATLRGGHPLVSLDFSPDGRLLAAGGYYVDDAESRGCVWVWDVATGNAVTPAPQVLAGLVSAVRYSPDGSTLAVACWDGAVYYCDPHSGTGAAAAFTQEGSVSALAFSPDGTTLATIAGKIKLVGRLQLENWVSLWERASGQRRLAPLRGHNGGVTCLAYSQDGKVLLSGGNDGKVTLWDAGTGATMQEAAPAPLAQHGISSIALAPDGGSMATGSEDGSIVLWNLQSGTCDLLQAHQQAVMQLAFSPDGRTLASAGTDQSVILWNRTAGVPDGALQRVHDAAVVGLTFDASGSVLAAGDARGVVAFWPFQLGAPLYKSAQSAAGRLWALVFTPDF
jgi:WD40 repeat protein